MKKLGKNTKEILLWILKAGGLIVASVIAPQLPYKLLNTYLKNQSRLTQKLRIMEKHDWIDFEKHSGEYTIKLTEKGKKEAVFYEIDQLEIVKPDVWDGFWRVVIFDIPEDRKVARNVLRDKLGELGFIQLQKSVFILPYNCVQEIKIIKQAYEVDKYVTFMVVKDIDCADILKKKFNL